MLHKQTSNGVKKIRTHIFVSGRVQGVCFRGDTQQIARELGLTGFVKNLPDGKVEIITEGEKEKVKQIVDWVRQGPPAAQVNNIDIEWEGYKGEFKDFQVVY